MFACGYRYSINMATSDSDLHHSSTTAYSQLVQYEKIAPTYYEKHNLRDRTIRPSVICYFGNDKLVAFDKNIAVLYDNYCDVKKRKKSGIELSRFYGGQSDSTALDGNRFAVSFQHRNVVSIYSSEHPGELKEDCELNVGGNCCGIDFIDGKLVVCFKDPPTISVLHMKTGFIHNIENEPKGNQLFTSPTHVAIDICKGQEMIYVSDKASWGLRHLTKIDTHGKMLSSFISLTNEDPKHVMTVGDGSVIFLHKDFWLMSENCQEVVKLLDNPGSIACVSYSKKRNLLFLVLVGKSTEILVYELKS